MSVYSATPARGRADASSERTEIDDIEVTALIESAIWPEGSPVALYVGRRGTPEQRRAALRAAIGDLSPPSSLINR